jgi:hypothetical protein
LGLRYWAHTARAHPTSVIVSISSVPTPNLGDHNNSRIPAEKAQAYSMKRLHRENACSQLADVAQALSLASVPTPTAEPANGEPEAFLDRKRRSVERGSSMGIVLSDLQMVSKLATVATPRGEDSQCTGAHRGTPDTLRSQANLATVTSPSARDWKDTSGMSEAGVDPDGSTRSRLDQLPRQAQLADSGRTATGGPGATGSGGQLDPAYSRWLMAVPPEWDDFACLAMQSVSKRPKPSSKHTSTRKDDHGD